MARTIAPANVSATQQTVKPAPCWHPAELRRITAHWVDAGASAADLRLLSALLYRVDDTGETFASLRTLAADTGVDVRTVVRDLAGLVDAGLVTERNNGPRTKTYRRPLYPPAGALEPADEVEAMVAALELDAPSARIVRADAPDPEPVDIRASARILPTDEKTPSARIVRAAAQKSARIVRAEVSNTSAEDESGFGDGGGLGEEGDQPATATPAAPWSDRMMAGQAATRARHVAECRAAIRRPQPNPEKKPAPPAAAKGDWGMDWLAGMAATRAGDPPPPSEATPTVKPCPPNSAPVPIASSRTAADG